MSNQNNAKPIRDWLLDKYTNAAQNLREQAIQIAVLTNQLRDAQCEVVQARAQHKQDLEEVCGRVGEPKQYEIWYRNPDGGVIELVPLAVGSCNGVTTLTVERKL